VFAPGAVVSSPGPPDPSPAAPRADPRRPRHLRLAGALDVGDTLTLADGRRLRVIDYIEIDVAGREVDRLLMVASALEPTARVAAAFELACSGLEPLAATRSRLSSLVTLAE
jgi:hypothetical protein